VRRTGGAHGCCRATAAGSSAEEQEQLKGSEERWRIVEQKLGEPGVSPGERERQERLEERLNIVEQKLGEPGVGPGERGRHQRLEERLNIVDQQLLDQDRRRSMVEQQWHNRHARRLEEQAKLLQELRDEQDRLRDEQEKIKNNEERIGEKNNKSGAAQSGSARGFELPGGFPGRRARVRCNASTPPSTLSSTRGAPPC